MYRQSEKKLVEHQYLLQMSLQYGELRPTNGWDRLVGLGHPIIFQRVSRLGSVTARQSSSGRQPYFAALNRGRHLCSTGRPSCWAVAHFLVAINHDKLKQFIAHELTILTGSHCQRLLVCTFLDFMQFADINCSSFLHYWFWKFSSKVLVACSFHLNHHLFETLCFASFLEAVWSGLYTPSNTIHSGK